MKLSSQQQQHSVTALLLALGIQLELVGLNVALQLAGAEASQAQQQLRSKLIDRCCQLGREQAIESAKFNCKLSAREALLESREPAGRAGLLALAAESLLAADGSLGDQCELVLESCCLAHHRKRNCDSGKQFAKSGAFCMDVELSKEASLATESFNDCCMACSLGVLAARNGNESSSASAGRCKLLSPLASSLSGQLYEQTYQECCQENLPRPSGALIEPGRPIDCLQSNPCSQRCIPAGKRAERDRCDCFVGYKLAADGLTCQDLDECKLGLHTCKAEEICDNTLGSFRCMARQRRPAELEPSLDIHSESFSPLRLCPLGFRWNSGEGRCESARAAGASPQAPVDGVGSQRSASLVAAAGSERGSRANAAGEWRR